jgi:hypothetical protein
MNIPVVAADAYVPVSEEDLSAAYALARDYKYILLSRFHCCELNRKNLELARMLENSGKEVIHTDKADMRTTISLITSEITSGLQSIGKAGEKSGR